MLIAYCHDKQKFWSNELAYMQLAINSSLSEATGFSPHSLMLGYKFSDPLRHVWKMDELLDDKLSPEELGDKINQAIRNVKRSVALNQKRHKYSRKFANHPFKVGDEVYVKTHILSNKYQGIENKMSLRYKGPYKILLIMNKVSVIAQLISEPKEVIKAHVSQLKK